MSLVRLTLSVAAVVSILAGAAWIYSATLEARAARLSVISHSALARGPALFELAHSEQPGRAQVLASLSSLWVERTPEPEPAPQMVAAVPPPPVAVASIASIATAAIPTSSDPAFTGAVSAYAPISAPREAAVPAPIAVGPKPATARPERGLQGMSRLAALAPFNGITTKELDEARTPTTAVYDITAKTVYMPNGERLEAHSGLGIFMDDPDQVHRKNRGPTPPNVYTLRLRESLFHGVQAIRMTPMREDLMFRRDGILAHSYLLGPSGQSNGCISFKDYPRFLKAFLRGDVDRIVVVKRLNEPPALVARSPARGPDRSL